MRPIRYSLISLVVVGLIAACMAPVIMSVRPLVVAESAKAADATKLEDIKPTGVQPTAIEPDNTSILATPTAVVIATVTPQPATVTPSSPAEGAEPESTKPVVSPTPIATRIQATTAQTTSHPTSATSVVSAGVVTTPAPPSRPAPGREASGTRISARAARSTPGLTNIEGVTVASDRRYVERPGFDPHQTSLDVYIPEDGQDLPVVIYVHGGGWSGGDHAPVGAKAAYFTSKGFVFVSINYRLMPAVRVADQAADVAAAIAWIRGHIPTYGGDENRLFLLGHSAGAHLSALVATDETYLRRIGLDLTAIRGVILLDSAAYDVEALMRCPEGQIDPFRAAFGSDPAIWRSVSPYAHVAPGKGIPPMLIVLATAKGQRRPAVDALATALRSARIYAQIADATAFRDHGSIEWELGRSSDSAIVAVQSFLDMLLHGAPVGLGNAEILSKPK